MITGAQIRAARAMLMLSRQQLANDSGVALTTLRRLESAESGRKAQRATLEAIRRAFERRGVIFIAADDTAADGVRLRHGSASGGMSAARATP